MSDSKHTTPDGIPILDSLAEEVFGSLSIDPRWFELPEDETLSSEGDAVVVNLLMYGENGTRDKRVKVRLAIESVTDWEG